MKDIKLNIDNKLNETKTNYIVNIYRKSIFDSLHYTIPTNSSFVDYLCFSGYFLFIILLKLSLNHRNLIFCSL